MTSARGLRIDRKPVAWLASFLIAAFVASGEAAEPGRPNAGNGPARIEQYATIEAYVGKAETPVYPTLLRLTPVAFN